MGFPTFLACRARPSVLSAVGNAEEKKEKFQKSSKLRREKCEEGK
jgi:hypothetical protein